MTTAAAPPEAQVFEKATTYTVALTPPGDVEGRRCGLSNWDVQVQWSGVGDLWAVRWLDRVFDADGVPAMEPIPSDRTPQFLARYRFPLQTAIELARRVAPGITVNGLTAVEALGLYGTPGVTA